ncbi:MAG: cell surface protein SprA, partial [Ignavibacteriaceae bacterium]|nr:cell surface protein SprA [Ignavibacteriaceae bacterium]
MWFNAIFKSVQAEYNQTLQQEHLTEPTFNSLQPDNQTSSLNLMDYLLPPENPDGMEFDFEIPDSDSGEQKTGEEKIELDPKEMLKDSTEVLPDSLLAKEDSLKVDTVKIDWRTLDSTARLEQFRFQREEKPYIEAGEKKQSKFFAQPTTNLKQRSVKIDSTGQYVEVREKIGTHEPKLVLRMPLEDYINLKLGLKEREDWEKLAYAYELKSGTVGLGELITSFTDFEIPLPSVGVLSIFGEPKISLKIGGSVQIHGAWRNETTEGVTANRLGNTRNEPDFKQQVQINVSGTIGDKLNINADWNTERTFEYENQLKIKYTGYEDEIIQSIEAGNVSMQTPSLIGGAEALFGVKALFQMGPFKLTTLASQKKGETKEVAVSGGSTSQEYSVRAYDYSENHYFIDKVYSDRNLKIFENYYA